MICEETPLLLTRSFTGTRKLDADLGTIVAKVLEEYAILLHRTGRSAEAERMIVRAGSIRRANAAGEAGIP